MSDHRCCLAPGAHGSQFASFRPSRSVGHSQAYSSAPYSGVVEGGHQVSQTAATYRGESVYDDLGVDLNQVDAYRTRPWLDVVSRASAPELASPTPWMQQVPNISGKRVEAHVVAATLEEWGGWDAVSAVAATGAGVETLL